MRTKVRKNKEEKMGGLQKVLEDYAEVTLAHSNNRICHKCNETIQAGRPYLHLRRNRHVYNICGKCLVFFTKKAVDYDATIKEDVVCELI